MAGSFSNDGENLALNVWFNGATAPALQYLALFTVAPTDSTGGTEVSGGNYTRVSITSNATNWPTASGGSISNGIDFTWPTASAGWGTVVAVGGMSASAAGTLYWHITLNSGKTVDSGDIFTMSAGQLVWGAD